MRNRSWSRTVVTSSSLLAALLCAGAADPVAPPGGAPEAEIAAPLAAAAEAPPAAEPLRRDTTGFYPIWEATGHVEQAGAVRIGTTGAQVGVAGVAHAGVMPVLFIERAPNAYARVALFASGKWSLAANLGAYRLLEGASGALFSPMYTSRLDNRDFALTLVPLSVAASFAAASWLEVHQTLTGLAVYAPGHLNTVMTPGYSVVAELNPGARHGLTLHAAEVGFWSHDLAIAGAAYRYRNRWLELRAGYFYRFGKSGGQASPLVSLGVML